MILKRLRITPTSVEHWLDLRVPDITSTDASALFGMSPYKTRFELWYEKRDAVPVTIDDNERMETGREIEPVIARLFARRYGVKIRALNQYARIILVEGIGVPHGIGASFDYEIVGLADDWTGTDTTYRDLYTKYGAGLLECKNVDGLVHARNWKRGRTDEGEDASEAPDHIEVQLQHQLECANRAWGVICPLIGGNRLAPIARTRDAEFGEYLRAEATKFWMEVLAGTPPPAVMPDDAEAVIRLYGHAEPGKLADLREDDEADAILAEYDVASADEKDAAERKSVARADFLTLLAERGTPDAERILTARFKVSAGVRAPTLGTLITEEMVGTRIGARKGGRGWRVTKVEEKG